jgi:2-C-methyl-D-erythritol 4-phosphate cytidylyltransferase
MGRNIAIITAGGSGKRINSKTKKQFIEINGRALLFWTLDKFVEHEIIDEILLVLPEEQLSFIEEIDQEYPTVKISVISGGQERQNSVYNALTSCPEDTEYVFIHDGVRPFITGLDISRLYESVLLHEAVIAASKVKNTIKSVSDLKIEKTIPRENLYNALTPQVFKYDLILKYHKIAADDGLFFTDDASILEHYGVDVQIVDCPSANIKITDKQDLELAELLLEKR